MAANIPKRIALRNKTRSNDALDNTSANMRGIARGIMKTAFSISSYKPL
jgi:hypothetical protein